MNHAFPHYYLLLLLSLVCSLGLSGCQRKSRDRSEAVLQRLSEEKTKTDDLRKAIRYLSQMTPSNAKNVNREVLLELNTWIKNLNTSGFKYDTPLLLSGFPADQLAAVGCSNPAALQFDYWDVDYLYERRTMSKLASWIVEFPVRDTLLAPILAAKQEQLEPTERVQLEEAYKLFDWTIRNVVLEAEESSSVERRVADPRLPLIDDGVGYGYLPWEVLLFSRGDFIERGRVFNALAQQRGIDTCWISLGAEAGSAGDLFAIGVLIGQEMLLFDPKLGMPILDPDTTEFATLATAQSNERVLRRLDLPGQFDYASDIDSLKSIQLLIDAAPVATSARMKLLEGSLIGDERMQVYLDVDGLSQRLMAAAPKSSVAVWQTPLLAQLQALYVREQLENTTPFTIQYYSRHGVWLMRTPAAEGRLKHLVGDFENTLDTQGALATYMESRIDDESIKRLQYDPEVQRELGVGRGPGEDKDAFEMRMAQTQIIFGKAKTDAAFLLAQLHFDRGNFEAAQNWLEKRVIDDARSVEWHAAAWYLAARTYQELGDLEQAAEALTHQPSPQEPGNRLRLRYLSRQE